ncbi:hypothetical protein [Coralloluteibacterium thermophilus]|uniref:Glycosyltransferase RgtA/B/C/D-like domain-containing protein n=1 Tax=Coralloluteibacterium thermophilum TaxID=2707049 RepID=A0ABV9NNM0_9GAMM
MIRTEASTDASTDASAVARWTLSAWLAGPALVIAGLVAHGMWRVLPWERFALALALALLSLALAWPLVRWRRWSWASALALVWCAALALFVGVLPLAAAMSIAAASLALGLRWTPDAVPGRIAIAAIGGYAVVAGLTGWVLPLRVHLPVVWWCVLGVLLVAGMGALRSELQKARAAWRSLAADSPRALAAAVLLLGLASTGAWLPTMQMDDLTYHLNLPAQLAVHGRYLADPVHGAWAFAPWMGDVGQGLAWVLGGREARGAVNGFWLVGAAAALCACARALGAAPIERLAVVALFASFPPLVWLMAGMQTELPAMAVTFALVALLLHDRQGRHLMAMTVLLAALAALKPMHAIAALPLALLALGFDGRRVVRTLPALVLAFVAVAGSSYVQAWWHTGNPLFPLFNGIFRSPLYPLENMGDARWHAGFGPTLPWRVTFETERYLEAWAGGIGFLWVGLAGAWCLALVRRSTRALALAALLTALLPMLPMQYVRYAFPGLLLLLLPALCGSREAVGHERPRLWGGAIVLLCAVNLAFQANAGWTHHSAALKRAIRAPGAPEAVLPHYVAERSLVAGLPAGDTGIVLATDPQRGHVAELAGRGRLMSGHAPALAAAREAAEQDTSGASWQAIFDDLDVRWILVTDAVASPALQQALAADGAVPVDSIGGITLWRRTLR